MTGHTLGRIARSRALLVASVAREAASARHGASAAGGIRSSSTRNAPVAANSPLNNSGPVSRPSVRAGKLAGKPSASPVASAMNSIGGSAASRSFGAAAAEMHAVYEYGEEMGVRAGRALQRGDLLFDMVKGVVFDRPGRHTIQIGHGRHLETESDMRLLNHSCEPNCRVEVEPSEQDPYVRVVAMKTVEPGESLTIDYNAMEIEMTSPFDCACGTSSCTGRIAGFSRLPIYARNEYTVPGQDGDGGGEGRKSLRLTPLVRAWAAENKDVPPRP